VWAIWGEDFVPLRQMRRALENHARLGPGRKAYLARPWARTLVSKIAKPGTTGHQRDALANALLRALERDALDDPDLARRFAGVVGRADPAAQSDGLRMLSTIKG
jgi:hypothetical protein